MSRMQLLAGRPSRPASHAGAGSSGSQIAHYGAALADHPDIPIAAPNGGYTCAFSTHTDYAS